MIKITAEHEGALDWLASGDELAERFLQKYRVECIPMVSVDGVVYGATHSAGYGYGGTIWHLDPAPKEVQNVKDFARSLAAEGYEFAFAGKLHGGMRYNQSHIMDFLTASSDLYMYMRKNANELGYWKPYWDTRTSLCVRTKGYFERFMLDEFLTTEVFGCHVQGVTREACYFCGRDLMKALADYMLKYDK